MKSKTKKTKGDLFLQLIDEMGVDSGSPVRQRFIREFMPQMKRGPEWDEELTDEEFNSQLAQMKKEIPAFLRRIDEIKVSALPPGSWDSRQN